jgi:PilZ domain
MDRPPGHQEKREFPRIIITLPLDFWMSDGSNIVSGIVINMSLGGFLIQSFKDLPVGLRIDVKVLFSLILEIGDFKAVAEIIWKDMDIWEGWEGYQYGLKFVQISNEERNKLEEVLKNQSTLQKI